jgi:hypothetical protein
MITNEQIRAIKCRELNPDTLRANFQVKPASTGAQASGEDLRCATAASLMGRCTVRPVNSVAIWKQVVTIARIIEPRLSDK